MDLSKIKDLKDLQGILDLMGKYDLQELELEGDGHKIRLKKAGAAAPLVAPSMIAPSLVAPMGYGLPAMSGGAQAGVGAGSTTAGGPAGQAAGSGLVDVKSPMVGSFYRAPSPEAEPFAKEGDVVEKDTMVCIIEAMKVMNEIPAGTAGIIREVCVKNGEPVEFGQTLFRIQPE